MHWQIQLLLEEPNRWLTVATVDRHDAMMEVVGILTRCQRGHKGAWRINLVPDKNLTAQDVSDKWVEKVKQISLAKYREACTID